MEQTNKPFPVYIKWLAITAFCLLAVMTILRIALYLSFPPSNNDGSFSLLPVFWLGFRFDARDVCILITLLFILCLIKPAHPLKTETGKKIAKVLFFLAILFAGIFYIVDFANYAYLRGRMNADLLNLMGDGKQEALGMMWQTYPIIRLIIALILFVGISYFLFTKSIRHFSKQAIYSRPAKSVSIVGGIVFFLLCGLAIFGQINQYPLRWSDAFSFGNNYAANIALNPFQSFFSSLKFRGEKLDIKKVKEGYPEMIDFLGIQNPDTTQLNYTRNYAAGKSATRPNVVFVICESFSFYKSSMSGNKLNPTPYFNQLCKDGVLFDRCFTPSYGTARGVWASITGVPDVDLNTTSSRNPKAVNQQAIMSQFDGYEKYYFIGGNLSWANIQGVLVNNIPGLHTYQQPDYDAPKIDVWGVSDHSVFTKANEVLSQQKQPFFAVIQTSDNHRPYTIPEEDKKQMQLPHIDDKTLNENGFASNDELNAFKYTDFNYKQFIESAKKQPYFQNTIFVFIGDHGIRGNASAFFPMAWNEQLSSEHVPLLIYSPKLVKPQLSHRTASQVDVMPTIAGLAQIKYKNTSIGRNLLDTSTHLPDGAFIYDYASKDIGFVQDSLYYTFNINNPKVSKFYSTKSNEPVHADAQTEKHYRNMTNALYYTSQYLLLNNKK